MKKNEWNEGLDHIDPDLIEKYVEQKDRLRQKKKSKSAWLRFGAIAACFALIVSAIIVVPMLREDAGLISTPGTTDDDNRPSIPIANVQAPSAAPKYYGSESGSDMSGGVSGEINGSGLSVTAQLVATLPDTYTFFDDWNQYEYRLLKMKTVKLLKGKEMTEEFYYMIPVEFMTDFSAFDRFVILDMAQFGYEYSVMYNQTQGKVEQLHLVLFGYCNYGYHFMGENFIAFDFNGNFDERLWNANDAWIAWTEYAQAVDTLAQAEANAQQDGLGSGMYVHLLEDVSGEAAKVLSQVKSFENGIYVPVFSSMKLFMSPEVQFQAVRYIDGFATNEKVSIWSESYSITKAQFSNEDLNTLPDLTSAFSSVVDALNNGSITPLHFDNELKLRNTTNGVFGWYAKTENGVIGIIRVTWCFSSEDYQLYYDDAYYIVEYGSDECKQIDRDVLLEKLGDYEATYIFTGQYDEYGKVRGIYYPMV